MNFNALGFRSARARAAAEKPALIRKADRLRFAMLREASEILAALPGPGEQLHALMTGRYDLMDVVTLLLEARPGPAKTRTGGAGPDARPAA